MGFWMKPECALLRLVEDDAAPIMARVRALQQVDHPPLELLRRLLVETKTRTKPIPSKLKAVATLKYAQEMQLRKIRRHHKDSKAPPNALGIV